MSGRPSRMPGADWLRHLAQSEKEFQADVVKIARLYGWNTYHPHDSRRSNPGWPDLAIWGHGRFLLRELKADAGYLSNEQRRVIGQLRASGVDIAVWRPNDLDQIAEELARPRGYRTPRDQKGTS